MVYIFKLARQEAKNQDGNKCDTEVTERVLVAKAFFQHAGIQQLQHNQKNNKHADACSPPSARRRLFDRVRLGVGLLEFFFEGCDAVRPELNRTFVVVGNVVENIGCFGFLTTGCKLFHPCSENTNVPTDFVHPRTRRLVVSHGITLPRLYANTMDESGDIVTTATTTIVAQECSVQENDVSPVTIAIMVVSMILIAMVVAKTFIVKKPEPPKAYERFVSTLASENGWRQQNFEMDNVDNSDT